MSKQFPEPIKFTIKYGDNLFSKTFNMNTNNNIVYSLYNRRLIYNVKYHYIKYGYAGHIDINNISLIQYFNKPTHFCNNKSEFDQYKRIIDNNFYLG